MRTQLSIFILILFVLPQQIAAKTVIIDTPDLCTRVEKIEGNRVDLMGAREPCPVEGPGRASIQIGEDCEELDIYVNGTHWKKQLLWPQSLSLKDVADITKEAKKHSQNVSIPDNQRQTEAAGAAKDLAHYFQSKEFQEAIESEKRRLYTGDYGDRPDKHESETASRPEKAQRLSPNERVYLFISSSVPTHTLRQYVRAVSSLKDPNIRIVMRGFIGGAKFIKPTVAFLKEILFVDPGCDPHEERCNTYTAQVIIDPMLFRRYRIERVPAFVYVPTVSVADTQISEGLEANNKASDHYVVYGDMSIEYALRLFSREWKSAGIDGLITACRGE